MIGPAMHFGVLHLWSVMGAAGCLREVVAYGGSTVV